MRLKQTVNGVPVYSDVDEDAIRFFPEHSDRHQAAAMTVMRDGQEVAVLPDSEEWADIESVLAAFEQQVD